ncbi:hypothetical protein BSK65_07325 [Paenibacillus odorifer]|uniref:GrpB family protein n=1 Tax=Paenibacillus odorifer TaxID=189426 RepID=A0A1R0ZKN5_9BACL|nr:GrpB family protein [Paenibacillus odorifer]OME72177.1 hypothetical protein BSK65_07325 [Paenibacillus odorifer]
MDVTVTQYNEEWNLIFQEGSRKIKEIFADALIDIHHIGSTSVPGLKAKPIIDMMPVVRNIEVIDDFNAQMTELGYECMGEFGMSGEAAEQYGNLKEDLANQFPKDIEAYMDGKEAFVTELERTALECYSNH